MSSTPSRVPDPDSRILTALGKAVRIVGQIITKEDLQIDSEVEGTIEAKSNRIVIGTSGTVRANIQARDITIFGQVQGNIQATGKVELRKDAKFVGDIKTARIMFEDGALFKGKIDAAENNASGSAPTLVTNSA